MTEPSPEVTARLVLRDLLKADLEAAGADPSADVWFGPPLGDAGRSNVWVGGVEDNEDHHSLRGAGGPSVLQRFSAHVHVDVEDQGATAEETTQLAWALVGRVRALVRAQTRGSTFGDGIQGSPKVVSTFSDGPVELKDGGYAEHVLINVQFTARI